MRPGSATCAERGESFLHLGDEFYLMIGEKVPASRYYDGFPQIEDGIGTTRSFDDWAGVKRRRGERRLRSARRARLRLPARC
ncbi:MAG: DUF512 domain-containing protein [Chloroflexia bacterium]